MNSDNYGLFGAVLLIGVSVYWFFQWFRSHSWLKTTGLITWAKVERGWSRYGSSESFEVSYKFNVSGDTFVGSNKMPGGVGAEWSIANFFGSARGDLQKYTVGSTVAVFYSPDNPKDCSLQRGSIIGPIFCALISIGLLFWSMNSGTGVTR